MKIYQVFIDDLKKDVRYIFNRVKAASAIEAGNNALNQEGISLVVLRENHRPIKVDDGIEYFFLSMCENFAVYCKETIPI